MAYRVIVNPFTGALQLINQASSGSGVTGIAPTTIGAIATWNNTTATVIQNTLTNVQPSGAIEAQAFISRRDINGTVIVNSDESWIASSLEMQPGSIVVMQPGAQIILI